VGEVEKEESVLVIRRIHVTYTLSLDQEDRDLAERVHGFHAAYCPIARTIDDSVAISTSLRMESTRK
jgi:uncharacterized OsmC-like protein